jgi:hypothetical protein
MIHNLWQTGTSPETAEIACHTKIVNYLARLYLGNAPWTNFSRSA